MIKSILCVSKRVSLSSCQMSSWFLQWRASFGWGRTSSWTERQQPSITSQSQPETWEPHLATARWAFITQTYTCKQPHTLTISSWAIRVLQVSLLCCKFNNNIQKRAFPTSNRWFVRFVHDQHTEKITVYYFTKSIIVPDKDAIFQKVALAHIYYGNWKSQVDVWAAS